ncbi:hypothetical protein Pfo_024588, partial [Paulownia fortunei]
RKKLDFAALRSYTFMESSSGLLDLLIGGALHLPGLRQTRVAISHLMAGVFGKFNLSLLSRVNALLQLIDKMEWQLATISPYVGGD